MASRAGRVLPLDVLFVFAKGAVIKKVIAVVALVAEGIRLRALGGIVRGAVLPFQEERPD
jgi:hypothetical protein